MKTGKQECCRHSPDNIDMITSDRKCDCMIEIRIESKQSRS